MHGVTSLGPSVIPSYLTGRPSAEITREQIIEILDLFKAAVRRAAEAGYDGIELHAAHGYRPIHETAQVAPELVTAGVNAFHVSGGVIDRWSPEWSTVPTTATGSTWVLRQRSRRWSTCR